MPMTRILVVEDDAAIVDTLTSLLRSEGYETEQTDRQDAAVALLESTRFDLALVDVSLAQGNGFAVCAAAKAATPSPAVIFLTASDDEYSTVAGLEMGAEDYIAKPFRARELLSRIRGALRRTSGASPVLALGDVEIDASAAVVRKGGTEVALSALEYRLLLLFAQNPEKLVTREAVRNAIWDSAGEYVSDNTLNVYIKRLRDKVETDPSHPRLIQTVRGLGVQGGSIARPAAQASTSERNTRSSVAQPIVSATGGNHGRRSGSGSRCGLHSGWRALRPVGGGGWTGHGHAVRRVFPKCASGRSCALHPRWTRCCTKDAASTFRITARATWPS